MKRHLSDEEIDRYIDSEYLLKEMFEHALSQDENIDVEMMKNDEIVMIEEHLTECDLCLKKVTKALDFSLSFQQWLEENPTKEQKMFLKILKATSGKENDIKARILNWLKNWQAFKADLIDVFMDTKHDGMANITKLLKQNKDDRQTKMTFRYPVESFVMRGDPNMSFEKRVENKLYGRIGEKDIMEINAQTDKKALFITYKRTENQKSSPIILLIPLHGGEPVISLSRETNKNDEYQISIEGLKPGKYLLAIEPENNL